MKLLVKSSSNKKKLYRSPSSRISLSMIRSSTKRFRSLLNLSNSMKSFLKRSRDMLKALVSDQELGVSKPQPSSNLTTPSMLSRPTGTNQLVEELLRGP